MGAPPKPVSVLCHKSMYPEGRWGGRLPHPVCPEPRKVPVTPHFLSRTLIIPCNYSCLLPACELPVGRQSAVLFVPQALYLSTLEKALLNSKAVPRLQLLSCSGSRWAFSSDDGSDSYWLTVDNLTYLSLSSCTCKVGLITVPL